MNSQNVAPAGEAQPTVAAPLQRFRVKRVVSGDSMIVQGIPQGGPPPEKQINLAWLIAPKIVRKGGSDGTIPEQSAEPWAWESREFLRKLVTGKDVTFKVEYKIPMGQTQREFGVLYLGETNVSEQIVMEGWAEVRQSKGEQTAEQTRLIELEEESKAGQKGRWSGTPPKRDFSAEVDDSSSLLKKTYRGIVDHVRDGSSFRVYVDVNGDGLKYLLISLNLSGVRCPASDQEFGDQAKYFSEVRILGRDVDVKLEQQSVGASLSFYGTLWAGESKNNLAEHLLQNGMAKCVDRTLIMTGNAEKLRAAEREAKTKRLRLWRSYVAPVATKSSEDTFEAKVLEVVGADSLMIQNLATNEVRKVFIASIRPPKLSEGSAPQSRESKAFRPLFDIPYMLDAREFLRSRLVGKKVQVQIDYIQAKTEQYPEKVGASITLSESGNSVNIGESLVSRGLASVIRYRPNDDQRASNYDALMVAEDRAQKGAKGMHSKKPFVPPRILDLSTDSAKAKGHLPFLTRPMGSRRDAIVEFVYSASRIRLWAQKDNCMLNFILAGVNAPKMTDPYGQEAMNFVKNLIHQRNVQIVVESIDKVGNFIGWLYISAGKGPEKNLAVELLRDGFASIRESGAAVMSTLRSLESEAKQKKIGIWESYVEPVIGGDSGNGYVPSDDEDDTKKSKEPVKGNGATKDNNVNGTTEKDPSEVLIDSLDKRQRVVVTQVAKDMTGFYAQPVDEGRKLEELLVEMRTEIDTNPPLPGSFYPDKGHVVAARFSQDNLWYRAKIEKVNGNSYSVLYVDYGNREVVKRSDMAPLPSSKFSNMPPVARPYTLAFIKLSTEDPEMTQEAYRLFSQDVADVELLLKSEYKDTNGHDAVTLVNSATKMDFGHQLVADGLALVDESHRRDRRFRDKFAQYMKAQETAMSKRLNLWQYGDFRLDDAREFGAPPPRA